MLVSNVLDQVHAVQVDVIQAPDKGRNERGPGLGRQQRLIGRETQGNVHHPAFAGQDLAGFETVPCQRELDRDVIANLGQLAAFGDHCIRFKRHNFGADRPGDQFANLAGDFDNVAA